MSRMVDRLPSYQSPLLPPTYATPSRGRNAAIFAFPIAKLPPLSDYARACASLIWATFPAASQRAVCDRASRETGAASADTFDRIVSGETRSPSGHLMQCVQIIAASRGVAIPPALVVRP